MLHDAVEKLTQCDFINIVVGFFFIRQTETTLINFENKLLSVWSSHHLSSGTNPNNTQRILFSISKNFHKQIYVREHKTTHVEVSCHSHFIIEDIEGKH